MSYDGNVYMEVR